MLASVNIAVKLHVWYGRSSEHYNLHLHTHKMAFCTRTLKAQWLKTSTFRPISTRWQSSLAHLQQEMPLRKIQPIFDDLSPQQSYRLDMSLADYLPATKYTPQCHTSITHQLN